MDYSGSADFSAACNGPVTKRDIMDEIQPPNG
jgi:hypothetical protein